MMLLRAPSGNRALKIILMGPIVWGPHALHGGRGAWGGAPYK